MQQHLQHDTTGNFVHVVRSCVAVSQCEVLLHCDRCTSDRCRCHTSHSRRQSRDHRKVTSSGPQSRHGMWPGLGYAGCAMLGPGWTSGWTSWVHHVRLLCSPCSNNLQVAWQRLQKKSLALHEWNLIQKETATNVHAESSWFLSESVDCTLSSPWPNSPHRSIYFFQLLDLGI